MVCLNFDVLQVGVRMFRKVVKFLRREPKMTDDSSVTVNGVSVKIPKNWEEVSLLMRERLESDMRDLFPRYMLPKIWVGDIFLYRTKVHGNFDAASGYSYLGNEFVVNVLILRDSGAESVVIPVYANKNGFKDLHGQEDVFVFSDSRFKSNKFVVMPAFEV